MRIAVGVVGILMMFVGAFIGIGEWIALGDGPDDNSANDWVCVAEPSTQSQDCSFQGVSPQDATYSAGVDESGVMIGCAVFIAGAAFVAGAVAGSGRPRPAMVPFQQPIAGPGPGPMPPSGPARA